MIRIIGQIKYEITLFDANYTKYMHNIKLTKLVVCWCVKLGDCDLG